ARSAQHGALHRDSFDDASCRWRIECCQSLRGADVGPFTTIEFAADLATRCVLAQQCCQFCGLSGFDSVEHGRSIDADAGKGMTWLAFVGDGKAVKRKVTLWMVRRIFYQIQPGDIALVHRMRISPYVIVFQHIQGLREIEMRAIDITSNCKKRFIAEQMACLRDAAGSFKCGVFY